MGMANHPDPPIVSVEGSTSAVDKVFWDAKFSGQMRGDGNSDWSFRESPGMNNTVQSEELLRPIHSLNKAAYQEHESHQLVLNNLITLKSSHWRLQNIEEHFLE